MIRRHELSDAEWESVRSLLPASLRGRKRLDDRRVLNGIVWKFRTGTAWRDVPERYGPWATLHTRFRRWALDGTFDRMVRAAQARADADGDIDWLVSVDQFVDPSAGHLPAQMLLLGLVPIAIGLVTDTLWGLGASAARSWFARSERRLSLIGGAGGFAMIGLGVTVAATGRAD